MSFMAARATLKMTGTELTRRHIVRTVTHINTLPQGDLDFSDFASDSLVSRLLSGRSSNDAPRTDTSRTDLVCRVNELADGESLRLERPLGNAGEIRAVRLNEKYRGPELPSAAYSAFNFRSTYFGRLFSIRDPHLLENVERVPKAQNKVSDRLTAQTKI